MGGAQVHLNRLTASLVGKGYPVEVVSLDENGAVCFEGSVVPIVSFRMDCIWKLHFWKNFLCLISYLRIQKPEIVHAYLNTSNVFGVLAAKIANVPIIISSRRDMGHFRSGFIGWLETLTGRLSNKIVCVSEAVRENTVNKEIQKYGKAEVIYNGVNEEIFSINPIGKKNNCSNIAMIASMDRKEKGHLCFIEAAEIVLKEMQDVRFILIGDGHLRPNLEKYVNDRKLNEYFTFKGKSTNLPEALKDIDMLVLPSESEGCSNALLEAMAMGIPAIATAVEGNLEVIEDGISGILVKPKDPSSIAHQILKLLDSPKRIRNLGIEARKRILQKFTLSNMVNNYTELYKRLSRENTIKKEKIGYIVSLFPCWSETFILNEIIEVEKHNLDVTILSMRRDLEKFTQEKAKPYLSKTKYLTYFGLFSSLCYWLLRKPFVFLSLFILAIRKEPTNLLKNIWCILVSGEFARIAKKNKLTHLHAHFATYPAFIAMCISRLTNIPFSFTAHAHDIFLDKPFLKEFVSETKEVVAISEYNKNYITEYCKNGVANKIQVIHCGVDIKEFLPIEKNENGNEKIIVGIGRLTEMKGFEYLIRACKKLESSLAFKCHIVGDGPLRNNLMKLTENLGLTNKVIFEGILDSTKINDLLSKTDVLVQPSIWNDKDGQEGIPVVLMEAMAKGIPVIASRISGIPELISDGNTGLLIEPKDENILANRILELTNNLELRNRLTENARIKIQEEFDVAKNADQLVNIFKNKIKVLFVIWSLERGGAERFLAELVKNLDKNKIEPTICCLNWKGEWAEEVEDAGIEVVALDKKNGPDFKALLKLIRLMRERKFDIVNTQLWESDSLGRIAAIFAGVPIIISTVQNVDLWKKWHHRIVDRMLALKTERIIAVSKAVKDFYHKEIGIPENKISIIPNAIDLNRFKKTEESGSLLKELNLSPNDFTIICIGRLTKQKGQEYLIKAVASLKDRYPQLKLILAGSGEDDNKLKKLTEDLKIDRITRFLGQRKDIPQLLSISDALVLPSLYEGLPLCVLEAMAAAKPVIVTDVGGNREIVEDGKNGFIVSPKDIHGLSESIKKLLSMPDKGKEMGAKGREVVLNKFSIQSISRKTEEIFVALVEKIR